MGVGPFLLAFTIQFIYFIRFHQTHIISVYLHQSFVLCPTPRAHTCTPPSTHGVLLPSHSVPSDITTFNTPSITPFPAFGANTWPYLITYVILRFLASSSGPAAIHDALWITVMQYSNRARLCSHSTTSSLSLSWHANIKTDELLRNKPTYWFVGGFEPALGAVIGVVMGSYIWASVVLTRYRTRTRRQMNERDVVTHGIHMNFLLNYEIVKYFGGEEYEAQKYTEAIGEYQSLERSLSLNLLNLVQTPIIASGLSVGSLIVASRITRGQELTSSNHTSSTSLSNLGSVYNQSLVDTEKLLHLLNEPTEVADKLDAKELVVRNGEVEFDNVSFAYDDQTSALHNISFKVLRGGRVALVSESGAGESTILRLLYRFYGLQPDPGCTLIDGQDIRTVTLSSLRCAVGVVPQDTVLIGFEGL
ncbi:hypothetical protein EDB19DRAFT_1646384 [Suillus lakei]|nr:hypothetical protein EDB19DRAFT_1646384 [Suillus lakei]